MKNWVCYKCGHLVVSSIRPEPIKWTDGHKCIFIEEEKEKEEGVLSDEFKRKEECYPTNEELAEIIKKDKEE